MSQAPRLCATITSGSGPFEAISRNCDFTPSLLPSNDSCELGKIVWIDPAGTPKALSSLSHCEK